MFHLNPGCVSYALSVGQSGGAVKTLKAEIIHHGHHHRGGGIKCGVEGDKSRLLEASAGVGTALEMLQRGKEGELQVRLKSTNGSRAIS